MDMNYAQNIKKVIKRVLFMMFKCFPIKNNKIVATTMRGRKYGDNPKYIVEYIKKLYPEVDVVWLVLPGYNSCVPSWIRKVPYTFSIKLIYELSTAKVWIDTHRIRASVSKRHGQVLIETWHGGLGIKKIEGDIPSVLETQWEIEEIEQTARLSDVFISNSDHLSSIYRRAFNYHGPIYKCGYPKNDLFFNNYEAIARDKKKELNITSDKRIVMYAPTYRNQFAWGDDLDFSVFDLDYSCVKEALEQRFGGEWIFLVKWHPTMFLYIQRNGISFHNVIDVTADNDMQSLLCAVDVLISDYSSCIFDAALRNIPCFTFAKDFEEYKSLQGTYFDLEDLPFPYAKNNDELKNNILTFDNDDYLNKWNAFKKQTGLCETGHATEDIATKIIDIMNGKTVVWN